MSSSLGKMTSLKCGLYSNMPCCSPCLPQGSAPKISRNFTTCCQQSYLSETQRRSSVMSEFLDYTKFTSTQWSITNSSETFPCKQVLKLYLNKSWLSWIWTILPPPLSVGVLGYRLFWFGFRTGLIKLNQIFGLESRWFDFLYFWTAC